MNRRIVATVLTAAGVFAAYAHAQNGSGAGLSASLSGFNEAPLSILSPGTGTLDLTVNEGAGTIDYTLTYSALSAPATDAHIHFGPPHQAGGIIAFLCSNGSEAPAGTPSCPTSGGTVTGTINAGSVRAIDPQNVPAGDFKALLSIINSGTAYANVHSSKFPTGEIRGQIQPKGNASAGQ